MNVSTIAPFALAVWNAVGLTAEVDTVPLLFTEIDPWYEPL